MFVGQTKNGHGRPVIGNPGDSTLSLCHPSKEIMGPGYRPFYKVNWYNFRDNSRILEAKAPDSTISSGSNSKHESPVESTSIRSKTGVLVVIEAERLSGAVATQEQLVGALTQHSPKRSQHTGLKENSFTIMTKVAILSIFPYISAKDTY